MNINAGKKSKKLSERERKRRGQKSTDVGKRSKKKNGDKRRKLDLKNINVG